VRKLGTPKVKSVGVILDLALASVW
jgi:hypothetical protein